MKMCAGFARNGAEVTLYARRGHGQTDPFEYYDVDRCFEIVYIEEPAMSFIGRAVYGWRTKQRIANAQHCPDVLYGRDVSSLTFSANSGIPYAVEAHTIHPRRFGRWLTSRLIRNRNCLGLVTISAALRHDYQRSTAGIADLSILVAHDAADDPVERGKSLEAVNESDSIRVGYVGNFYRGKGMEVISDLSQRQPDTEFHVVGGSPEDIRYWQDKKRTPNLRFHGYVPHSELSEKFVDMDICLLPLQREVNLAGGQGEIGRWTSPLKLFEYMSYGKAIIASDVPVLREVLSNRRNALLVEPDDFDGWAQAVSELAGDRILREGLGAQARSDFLEHHTWTARARNVMEMLRTKSVESE